MSALVLTLLRLGFLALLWIFVFSVVFTLRRDVYGTQVRDRRALVKRRRAKALKAAQQPQKQASSGREPQQAPARQAPATVSALTVTAGPLTGTSLPLGTSQIIVGRSPDSALVLDDSYSSSRHARFYQEGGQWWVEDLDSTNGTYIGGNRITTPTPVGPGVPVVIGRTTMELR